MISDYFYPDKKNLSLFQPEKKVVEITKHAKEYYQRGHEINSQNYPELNDRSIINDEQNGKKIWNAYVDESCDDPFESWKWKGTRGEARKRGMALHAQLTAGFLFANITAQDEDDKEDRAAGDFMRGVVEWMTENSNYTESFIQTAMGMLYSPVVYMGAEFAKVIQKVKNKTKNGFEIINSLDEELSGFRAPVYSAGDIKISNAYVQNIQRQTCVIKDRYLDYHDAEKKYGHLDNFDFVQKGQMTVFNENDGVFYDTKDLENPDLVKETIVSWRGEDLEVPFLGGIYMGDDDVNHNPMSHRDLRNQPKYDVVPFGYSRISEHFYFYKSLMNSLQWEDNFYDEFSRNVLNRELIDLIPPTVAVGDEDGSVNTSVIFPGASISSKSKDFDVRSILPPRQGNPYAALSEVKKSIEEQSISDTQSGQLPEASQKATAIVQATAASRRLIRGLARNLGNSIVSYWKLMTDIGVRQYSIPEIHEMTGGFLKERYRQFLLPNKTSRGKIISKILRFDGDLVGQEFTEEELMMKNVALLEEAGEGGNIIVMNPEMVARMKYLISYDPEDLFIPNQQQMQVIMQNLYSQLRADPLVDAEPFMREYMYSFFRSKGDDFIVKNPEQALIAAGREQRSNIKMPTPVSASPETMV